MAERTSPTGRNLPAFHCQLLIALVLLCSVMGCRGNHNAAAEQEDAVDLQQIKDNGELVVLTLYSSTSLSLIHILVQKLQYRLHPACRYRVQQQQIFCRYFIRRQNIRLLPEQFLIEQRLRDTASAVSYTHLPVRLRTVNNASVPSQTLKYPF